MKELKDYIFVVPDVVPLELCDAVLNEFSLSNEWVDTYLGGGHIDKNIRSANTIIISYPQVIDINPNIRKTLDNDLFESAAKAIKNYNDKFSNCRIEEDSGYELLRYKVGEFYIQHIDSFKDRPRAVSCSFALNDDYEGGEFAFFNRELVYKLKKGSCIMFPSNFMYPHEIMPVTSGTRYSIVTWFV